MKKLPVIIPKDSLLTITTGEYSSYIVQGVFKALQDIDTTNILSSWVKDNPEQDEYFDEQKFIAYIFKQGFIEPIYSFEWCLNIYPGETHSDSEVSELKWENEDE